MKAPDPIFRPAARGLASATCIVLALGVPRLRAADTNALIPLDILVNGQLQAVEPCPTLTNHFFLTEGGGGFIMSIPGIGDVVNPEVVEKARHAKESQPAEEDPEGNWGKPVDGLQMSIRFDKASFAPGEPIVANVIFRNLTNHLMAAPAFVPDYHSELVVADEKGKPLETRETIEERKLVEEGKITDFQRRLRHILQDPKWASLMPHCQYKCTVALDKLFDMSQPGRYRIFVLYRDKDLSTNATSGTAQITITAERQPKPLDVPKSTQP